MLQEQEQQRNQNEITDQFNTEKNPILSFVQGSQNIAIPVTDSKPKTSSNESKNQTLVFHLEQSPMKPKSVPRYQPRRGRERWHGRGQKISFQPRNQRYRNEVFADQRAADQNGDETNDTATYLQSVGGNPYYKSSFLEDPWKHLSVDAQIISNKEVAQKTDNEDFGIPQ
jgi:hypothetical protein